MKQQTLSFFKLFLLLLLGIVLLQTAWGSKASLYAQSKRASKKPLETASAVLNKHLDVMGGRRLLSSLNRISYTISVNGVGLRVQVKVTVAEGQGFLTRTKIEDRRKWQLVNKEGIWEKGPEDLCPIKQNLPRGLPSREALMIYSYLPNLYLFDYAKRGLNPQLKSRLVSQGGRKYYVIEVTRSRLNNLLFEQRKQEAIVSKKNKRKKLKPVKESFYIDSKTFLLYQIRRGEQIETYSDYRLIRGLRVPHLVLQELNNGNRQGRIPGIQMRMSDFKINPPINASLFRAPECEPEGG